VVVFNKKVQYISQACKIGRTLILIQKSTSLDDFESLNCHNHVTVQACIFGVQQKKFK